MRTEHRHSRSPAKTWSARAVAVPLMLLGCWLELMVSWVDHAAATRDEHRRNVVGYVVFGTAAALLFLAAEGPELALPVAAVIAGFGLLIEGLRFLARALVRLLGPHLT